MTTKVHVVCDARGVPLATGVTAGQASEGRHAADVLAGIRVAGARGRPLTKPAHLIADRGYDSRANRAALRNRGIRAVIPERRLPQGKRRRRRGRPSRVTKEAYRRRSVACAGDRVVEGVSPGGDALREIGGQLPRDTTCSHAPQTPQDLVSRHSLV